METVAEVCFGVDDLKYNVCSGNSYAFIRGSYCSEILYNDPFFDSYLFHWSPSRFEYIFDRRIV